MSLQPRVAQHLPLLRGEGLFWSLLLPASLHRQVRLRTDLVSKAVSSSPHSRSLAFSFVVFLKQLLTSLLQMWDHKAGKMSYILGKTSRKAASLSALLATYTSVECFAKLGCWSAWHNSIFSFTDSSCNIPVTLK